MIFLKTPLAQELGKHSFRHSLILHSGDFFDTNIPRLAREFYFPLEGIPCKKQDGDLNPDFEFLTLDADNSVITTMKKGESGGIVVRLFETRGVEGKSVTMNFNGEIEEAFSTNFLEREMDSLEVEGGTIKFHLKPQEIKTILLKID